MRIGKAIFDAENKNSMPSNSYQLPVQSDLSTEETWDTPLIAQECSREFFPQTEELCDVTDTYPDMDLHVETMS